MMDRLLSCLFYCISLALGIVIASHTALADTPANVSPATDENQQKNKVYGTVKDQNGDVLVGAFIYIKGPRTGVSTNMETKEIMVDSAKKLDVFLNFDNELDEAVIVGAYGTKQRREDLVGSAFQVNSDALKDKPVARIDNLLEGMVPGLTQTNKTVTITKVSSK